MQSKSEAPHIFVRRFCVTGQPLKACFHKVVPAYKNRDEVPPLFALLSVTEGKGPRSGANPSLTAINIENQLITRFRPAKGPKAQTFGPFLLYLKQG
jgi:hypothetical protein